MNTLIVLADTNLALEIVGYVGMGFVLLSFLMQKVVWLRIVNLIGAILCCIYGFMTATYPTAILNLSLIVINTVMLVMFLVKQKKAKKSPVASEGEKKE